MQFLPFDTFRFKSNLNKANDPINNGDIPMDATNAVPAFGGRRKTEEYYATVSGIIRILRNKAPLSVIATHLNSQGLTTPTGLPFTRDRLTRYIKSNTI